METLKEQRRRASKPLMWIGLGSIVMAFAGLTSGYVVSRTTLVEASEWLTFTLPSAFVYSTIVLLASSLLMWWSKKRIAAGDVGQLKSGLTLVALLGVAFIAIQVVGWGQLVDENIFFAGAGSNPAGSWVYAISLFHIAHVVGGIIALIVTLIRAFLGRYSAEDYHGVALVAIYWHFVDLLWLYLYVFLSVIR
ncbi:MAG: hypothetical protein RL754_442 [Bacteroidota bacterium]|jgi:cytochrome c oxidase subunit 3